MIVPCGECRVGVERSHAVILNGEPLHIGCFRVALKKLGATLRRSLEAADLVVDVRNVDAPIAYSLGQDTALELLGGRRRAPAPAPHQKARRPPAPARRR